MTSKIRYWTTSDIQFLRDNSYIGAKWLANELNRSVCSVRKHAQENGISLGAMNYRYTKEEVSYLKANYKKIPVEEIAQYLGRNKWSIYNKMHQLRKEEVKEQ